MVTRPLDLLSKLRKPPASFDAFYFVNVALIALFFFVFGSRFVIAPGIVVGGGASVRDLSLPVIAGAAAMGRTSSVMISVVGRDVVLTRDGKYTFEEFRRWIFEQGIGKSSLEKSLLVKMDISVSMKDFAEIFDAAKKAGFDVLMAAESGSAGLQTR